MKALMRGGGNNFSFGTQSKNLFVPSLKELYKTKIILYHNVDWMQLPGVDYEKSRYGYNASNWEYSVDLASCSEKG